MGLIKSESAPATMSPFSMKDVETQARALLAGARRAAERLLAEAQREGEALRAQAHAEGLESGRSEGREQGLAEGLEAGRQQALGEHSAALGAAVSALSEALQQFEASRRALEAEALQDVVQLATAIGRRVTKRQGAIDPQVLLDNAREAMRLVVHAADLRIAIHPSQRATLEEALPALGLEFPQLAHAAIIEDPELAPGGCRLMTPGGVVDAGLDAQLDRVIADLLPSTQEVG